MDFFKLGLRNILGITLPGAVLVLVVSYMLYVCAIALDQSQTFFEWVKDAELLILVGSFLISYIIGSVMRLNSADIVDKKSADLLYKEKWEGRDTNTISNQVVVPFITDSVQIPLVSGIVDSYEGFRILNLVMTGALALAIYKMKTTILRRFRTLRIKEVDTVYDAFYLVNQNERWRSARWKSRWLSVR